MAYLGPKGTFTQKAAQTFAAAHKNPMVLLPLIDIDTIFENVLHGICDIGVIPIENSTEGAVNVTLDALLREEKIVITSLISMPISHVLMGYDTGKILAHPQALAQCRQYIRKNYPDAELMPCTSNADAAKRVADKASGAAIGPLFAADEYRLSTIDTNIQDSKHNCTAFIQIEKATDNYAHIAKKGMRTSIIFSTKNEPGALYKMLGILDKNRVNMTKILSRPLAHKPGEYVFFVDIEGYKEADAAKALKEIEQEAVVYRFLGSYRAW